MANPEHLERLLAPVEVWNKWREQHPLEEPDLSDLGDDDSPLVGAKLMHADLRNAILTNTNLRGADLRGAKLGNARLNGVKFEAADLTGADLRKADLQDAHLCGTRGLSYECREPSPDIQPDPNDLSQDDSTLVGAKLMNADLRNAILANADLRGVNLRGANLRGAKLDGVKFEEADLTGADLRGASLRGADLCHAAGLSEEQLAGTDLEDADLPIPIPNERIHQFDEKLERIESASHNLQTLSFALLIACVYSWLTIVSTTDAQLLTDSASSPLPIIGTKISIIHFYHVMPWFLLVFYIFFHLHLQRLWDMLADLPAVFPDGTSLDQRGHPRYVSGFVRAHFSLLKQRSFPDDSLYGFLFMLLTWFNVPLTLLGFWWNFLPRRDLSGDIGTVVLTMIISITTAFGLWSYNRAVTTLQRENFTQEEESTLFMKLFRGVSKFTIFFIGIAGYIIFYNVYFDKGKVDFSVRELCWLLLCGSLTLYFRIPSYGRMIDRFFKKIQFSKRIKDVIDIIVSIVGASFVTVGMIFLIRHTGEHEKSGWILLSFSVITMLAGVTIFRDYLMSIWWRITGNDNDTLKSLKSNSRESETDYEKQRYQKYIYLNMSIVPTITFCLSVLFLIKITQDPICWTENIESKKESAMQGDWRMRSRNIQGRNVLDELFCYPIANLNQQDIATKSPNWPGQWEERADMLVTGASLKKANLNFALAHQAFFVKTNLYGAKLENATLVQANFRQAQLRKAKLSKAHLHWADLSKADLREADLRKAILYGATLEEAHLSRFTDCDRYTLDSVDLEKADLRTAKLDKADLKGANLKNTDLRKSSMQGAQLSAVNLSNADLADANLQSANLAKIPVSNICREFPEVELETTNLAGANLTGAKLNRTNLAGAKLQGVNWTDTQLDDANLYKANLSEPQLDSLSEYKLEKACIYSTTQLPSKFESLKTKSMPVDHEKECKKLWDKTNSKYEEWLENSLTVRANLEVSARLR